MTPPVAVAVPGVDVYGIGQVCHEANRAYCRTIGDFSQAEWLHAPAWQQDSAAKGVELHWRDLESGVEPSPRRSHESWLKVKQDEGWKYGPVKDAEKKEHPCFVPYDELPASQKLKDYIFVAIVKAFFAASHSQA